MSLLHGCHGICCVHRQTDFKYTAVLSWGHEPFGLLAAIDLAFYSPSMPSQCNDPLCDSSEIKLMATVDFSTSE